MVDVVELEKRVDRAIAAPIPINAEVGGVALENMGQVMEFAKLMAVSGAAVPKYLRGNPGACLAICSRALRWQMDPFAVAEKSYMVTNKGEERIAFEAQLVHAVITARDCDTRLSERATSAGARCGGRSRERTSRTSTPARRWPSCATPVVATSTATSKVRHCGTQTRRCSWLTPPCGSGVACTRRRFCSACTRRTSFRRTSRET